METSILNHETFWSRVDRSGDCWNWRGPVTGPGYGQWVLRAHRVAYELMVGPIREETLDHLCHNKKCVNPDHMEPVSRAENSRRAATRQPGDPCPSGHIDDWYEWNNRRWCRPCRLGQQERANMKRRSPGNVNA